MNVSSMFVVYVYVVCVYGFMLMSTYKLAFTATKLYRKVAFSGNKQGP